MRKSDGFMQFSVFKITTLIKVMKKEIIYARVKYIKASRRT
jgi:hypothetical protein